MSQATNLKLARLNDQKKSMERELEDLVKQKDTLQNDFRDAKQEKEALITKVNEFETKMQELSASYEGKIENLNAAIGKLKTGLAQKEKELPERYAEISFLKKLLKNDRIKMEAIRKKVRKNSAVAETNTPVALQPITVTAAAKKLSGKVIDANTEYGFIVADIGSRDGVKTGDMLFVSRKSNLLGKIIVEKVRDSICVAKILYKSLADSVKKGDMVSN
jgi:DNA repair exonuclease SbcCD ATPase subunit